ncbi:hypothetical protein BgAZ_405120 [Babesia gibsoni]|uniref:Uncharacterized protein n=1 Tax=Babesia gibsoni TaxID=33632 RepID=A0AAD8LQG0_BABGI|nr:hypothetical protein BgAZ_405120 [Babesia gibsoni]
MGDACPYCGIHTEPTTLKEALEFCSKLSICGGSRLEEAEGFLAHIKKEVNTYYRVGHYFNKCEGSAAMTIHNCHEIYRKLIDEHSSKDPEVSSLLGYSKCLTDCAATFECLVPQLFGTLYFLYFMCNKTEFGTVGGGLWESAKTVKSDNNLQGWLTDQSLRPNNSNDKLLKGGFTKAELSEKHNVESLVNIHYGSDWLIGGVSDGYLQRLLAPIIFRHAWHRGKTAHTLLFLKEFIHVIRDVNPAGIVGISEFPAFLNTCNSCHVSIQRLFEKLYPVCKEHTKLYEGAIMSDHESLNLYYNWIKENVDPLITSLKEMKVDCSNWNQGNVICGKSYGPFPWGFVFMDTDWVSGQNDKKFMAVLKTMIEDLNKLKELSNRQFEQLTATSGEEEETCDVSTPGEITTIGSDSESGASGAVSPPASSVNGDGGVHNGAVTAYLSTNKGTSKEESTSSNANSIAAGVTAVVAGAAAVIAIQHALNL